MIIIIIISSCSFLQQSHEAAEHNWSKLGLSSQGAPGAPLSRSNPAARVLPSVTSRSPSLLHTWSKLLQEKRGLWDQADTLSKGFCIVLPNAIANMRNERCLRESWFPTMWWRISFFFVWGILHRQKAKTGIVLAFGVKNCSLGKRDEELSYFSRRPELLWACQLRQTAFNLLHLPTRVCIAYGFLQALQHCRPQGCNSVHLN